MTLPVARAVALSVSLLGACAGAPAKPDEPTFADPPAHATAYQPQPVALAGAPVQPGSSAAPRKVVRAPAPGQWAPEGSPLLGSPQAAGTSGRAATAPPAPASLWAGGLTEQPAALPGPDLSATELYSRVRDSVFYIVGGESYEHAISRKGSLVSGSAVAVSKQVMITNCHVVQDVRGIVAYSRSGFTRVRVLKQHPSSDRCALEVVDGRELAPIAGVRAASDLKVGERVYSVGSPLGLESTLGEGIVSGLHPAEPTGHGMTLIQTTAQVSRGSSGGGLFDARGNLIGITTFKRVNGEALNFAIPADAFWTK